MHAAAAALAVDLAGPVVVVLLLGLRRPPGTRRARLRGDDGDRAGGWCRALAGAGKGGGSMATRAAGSGAARASLAAWAASQILIGSVHAYLGWAWKKSRISLREA